MSYNAGSIDSRLTLDRTPFSTELRAARAEADAFARNPVKIRLELDRSRADAELRAFEGRMAIATRDRTATIRIDQRNTLNDLRRLQDQINGVPNATRRASREAEKDFSLIRAAIELLGPPLIPLAGGILAIGAGAVSMAAVGVGAFLAVKQEIKDGTRIGQQYNAGLVTLKTTLGSIEDELARSTLSGFDATIGNIQRRLPQLNGFLVQSGHLLGDTVSHAVDGLLGGLNTFAPLLLEVERGIDGVATRFDAWANGPGGERFAKTLSEDLHETAAALGQLIPLVGNVVSAFAPIGAVILRDITALAKILNWLDGITHGTLGQVLAFGYIALRVSVYVDKLTASLLRLSVAEARAGAGAGAAGAAEGGGFLARVGRYAGPIAATAFALNGLAHATDSWRTSTNEAKAAIGQTLDIFAHPLSFIGRDRAARDQINAAQQIQSQFSASALLRPSTSTSGPALPGNATPEAFDKAQSGVLADIATQQQKVNQLTAEYNRQKAQDIATLRAANLAGKDTSQLYQQQASDLEQLNKQIDEHKIRLYNDNAVLRAQSQAQGEYQRTLDSIFTRTSRANATGLSLVFKGTQGQGLDQVSGALAKYQNQLQKNINIEKQWLDTSGKSTITLNGQKYSVDAASKALALSNGNVAKAAAYLQGHRAALELDILAQQKAADEQARIDTAIGVAQTKYQLTTQQINMYAEALGISAKALAEGTLTTGEFVRDIGRVKDAIDQGSTALGGWITAVDAFNKAGDTLASRAALIGAALVSLNGDTLSYANTMVQVATANQQMVTDLANVKKGVIDLKTGTIDYHNAAAAPLLADLQAQQTAAANAAAATYQHEVAMKHGKATTNDLRKAAKDAALVFRNDTTKALVAEAQQLGLTRGEAKKLADNYFHFPKKAVTQIEALGGKDISDLLAAIGQQLSYLTGQPFTVNVDANVSPKAQAVINAVNKGLPLPGGAGVHLGAAGGIFKAYAGGGENHVAQIAKAGDWRVWAEPETQGEAYIPFADDWRRPRAKDITRQVAHKLGGVAYFAGGGEQGGFGGVDYGGGTGSKSGSSATSTATSDRSTKLKNLLDGITSALSALGQQVNPIAALASSLNALTQALRAAEKDQGGGERLITRLKRDERSLREDIRARDRYEKELTSWTQRLKQDRSSLAQYRTGVRDTFLGQFDIGTSGQGYAAGIKYDLQQAAKNTTLFDTLKDKAQKLGLDPRLIAQLEQEGPQGLANLQAIVAQGKTYVQGINKDYATLYGASTAIARDAAKDNVEINRRIERDQHEIKILTREHLHATRRVRDDMDAIRKDVRSMERRLRAALAATRKSA